MEWVVPEYGLGSQYGFEEMQAIAEALQADGYEGGEFLRQFEAEFAEFCGAKHAIGVTSGTTALHVAAHALGLGPSDEVVCTPQTFQATMLPFLARKVRVNFADIEPDTLCIDPDTVEAKITPKTKAIYVMHYGGLPTDMDPIMEIARRRSLPVVEDAAHAPGARCKGRPIGGIGDITCFSFGSLKNMTTLGQGGMITTNNDDYAQIARALQGRGMAGTRVERGTNAIGPYPEPSPRYGDHAGDAYTHDWTEVTAAGMNAPMTGCQANVGRVQLRKLDRMSAIRRELAAQLDAGLTQIEGVRVQPVTDQRHSVYHLYPFFLSQKESGVNHDDLIRGLQEREIRITNRFFPCHLSSYMRPQGHEWGECPVIERVWFDEQVNLPISPLHTPQQMDYVIEQVTDLVARLRP